MSTTKETVAMHKVGVRHGPIYTHVNILRLLQLCFNALHVKGKYVLQVKD